jgi:DNA-binding NarL/FixJ family response regulator
MVLAAEEDLTVVGTARSCLELLEVAEISRPEVVILDIDAIGRTPGMVVAGLRMSGTKRVIGLYEHLTRAQARELEAAGAKALIDRRCGVDAVFRAVRGRAVCGAARAGDLLAPGSDRRVLTAREIEVLGFVGQGITSREISDLLGISRKTVENYKQRAFQKLGVQNQAHAVSVAMRRGLFAPVTATSA